MKRFLTLLLTTLALLAALCVTASASDFDAAAKELSAIGVFRGTANGFELERAPTRSEAAIMLVRLYGAEEKAKTAYDAGKIQHPFTDVSDFTAPYVAWLYTNGITNGTSATTFGSAKPCSAQNYVVFLLRALGYKDNVDFQYADALTFAQQKGFYDAVMFSCPFLRDDLAALTYQALAADTANGRTYLLDALISSGAVSRKDAKPLTDRITAYRAMQKAVTATDTRSMALDMTVRMDATTGGEVVSTNTKGSLKVIAEEDANIQMAYSTETTAQAQTVRTEMWMKDGWVYTASYGDGTEQKVKYAVNNPMALLEDMGISQMRGINVSGLAMLESVTSRYVGGKRQYTLVIGEGMNAMKESVLASLGAEGLELRLGKMTVTYTLNYRGAITQMTVAFTASLQTDGQAAPAAVDYAYDMTMTVSATGQAVQVEFPDFTGYEETAAPAAA